MLLRYYYTNNFIFVFMVRLRCFLMHHRMITDLQPLLVFCQYTIPGTGGRCGPVGLGIIVLGYLKCRFASSSSKSVISYRHINDINIEMILNKYNIT